MVTEYAYAKLNLTLEMGEKRRDGFHEITSIMTSVSLCDRITVEKEAAITLLCDRSDLPLDVGNLAVKAAVVFFRETGIEGGAAIQLKKKIPSEAGLGGGSSDAAAVLRALRRLYAPEISLEELAQMGGSVGSDVPYCVHGGTVLCRGRGEQMTALPDMPLCWYVIVKPTEAFSTGKMYGEIDARKPTVISSTDLFIKELEQGNLSGMAAYMNNTFQAVIPAESRVWDIQSKLRKNGAINAMMTGSGSAVFGIFDREEQAKIAAEILKIEYPETFLARNV